MSGIAPAGARERPVRPGSAQLPQTAGLPVSRQAPPEPPSPLMPSRPASPG